MSFFFCISILLVYSALNNISAQTCHSRYTKEFSGQCIGKSQCTGALIHGLCPGSTVCCIPDPKGEKSEEEFISKEDLVKMTSLNNPRINAISKILKGCSSEPNCNEKAAFLAQLAHESGNFMFGEEVAANEEYFDRYNNRIDLGNTEVGDGRKYRGRGFIQITGRNNYHNYGEMIGKDLINNPEYAALPSVAAEIACKFWLKNSLGNYSDGTFHGYSIMTQRINGGLNGLDDRTKKLEKMMKLLKCEELESGKGKKCELESGKEGFCKPMCPGTTSQKFCGCSGKTKVGVCPGPKNIICCEDPEYPCCSPDILSQLALISLTSSNIPKLCHGRCDDSVGAIPKVCCTPELVNAISSLSSCLTCGVPNICRKCDASIELPGSKITKKIIAKNEITYYTYNIGENPSMIVINLEVQKGSIGMYSSFMNQNPNREDLMKKKMSRLLGNQIIVNITVMKESVRKMYIGIEGKEESNEISIQIKEIKAPCSSNPCLNGGFCTNSGTTSYYCACVSGYTGKNCETNRYENPCLPFPCLNGGTCQANSFSTTQGSYTCLCPWGFTGKNCETNRVSTTTTTQASLTCFDKNNSYCPYYAARGFCKPYYFIDNQLLTNYCAKSCRTCEITHSPHNRCQDQNIMCSYYYSRGYCQDFYFIDGISIPDLCSLSCKTCTITHQTTTTTPSLPCIDRHISNCKYYARQGFCKEGYYIEGTKLLEYCSKSCNSCDD